MKRYRVVVSGFYSQDVAEQVAQKLRTGDAKKAGLTIRVEEIPDRGEEVPPPEASNAD